MPNYGSKSERELKTCHPDLQILFKRVIRRRDHSVLEGHRGKSRQNLMVDTKRSKVRYPDGRHNSIPSDGADIAPYYKGIDWRGTAALKDVVEALLQMEAMLALEKVTSADYNVIRALVMGELDTYLDDPLLRRSHA